MSDFIPDPSDHSFGEGDLVVDVHGIRGIVHDASALYAVIRWEDGRETEVDQGDPRVQVEARGDDYLDSPTPELAADYDAVQASFSLWNTAGPKPEERPLEEEPAVETPERRVA